MVSHLFSVSRDNKKWVFLLFFLLLPTLSSAHTMHVKRYAPVAICYAMGTSVPLPYFVCCKKKDNQGHIEWKNTWVATACQQADPMAVLDKGCKRNSPVYGSNKPMIGKCQFSYSTGKMKYSS